MFTTYVVVISGFSTALVVFVTEILWKRCFVKEFAKTSWPVEIVKEYNNNKAFPTTLRKGSKGNNIKKDTQLNINGRDYVILPTKSGGKRLIPLRTPSAFLFQYPNKN